MNEYSLILIFNPSNTNGHAVHTQNIGSYKHLQEAERAGEEAVNRWKERNGNKSWVRVDFITVQLPS